MPITSYRLFSNFRCARRMIHPGNCSPAPSPVGFNCPIISQSFLFEFSCANPATPFTQDHLFSKLYSARARSTLKTPLAPSPACFNHSIIFESLLLQLSRANPPAPIAPDLSFSKFHSLPPSTRKKGAAGTPLTALQSRAAAIESPPPKIP